MTSWASRRLVALELLTAATWDTARVGALCAAGGWLGLLAACDNSGDGADGTMSSAGQTPDDDDDDDDDDGDDDDSQAEDKFAGACTSATRVGGFEILLSGNETTIAGRVADGVVPSSIQHEQQAEGSCRLVKRIIPVCDPPCIAGQTCHPQLGCIAEPLPQNLGTVEVDGLAVEVAMEPLATNVYFNTSLPHPGYDTGAEITLHAPGKDLPAFDLDGLGVAYLAPLAGDVVVVRGVPLTVNWTPGRNAATNPVAMNLFLNIDQHGSSPASIECTVPDTGTADIPTALIDAMFDSGVSGFPSLVLTRRTADSVELDVGCAEFVVMSRVDTEVQVEGHIPCKQDADCPDGMTCNLATETCE